MAAAYADHIILMLIISSTFNYCPPVCINSSGIPHQLADFHWNRFKADIYNSVLGKKKKSDWITVHKPVYSCLASIEKFSLLGQYLTSVLFKKSTFKESWTTLRAKGD